MPGLGPPKRDQFFQFLQAAMGEFGINTPAREAAFVAQLAHESGAAPLHGGNLGADRRAAPLRAGEHARDASSATRRRVTASGSRAVDRSRSPAGRTTAASATCSSLDLLAAPERAAVPDAAFRIAGLFWKKNGLNELADQATPDAFREITRRINGGFNGLKDREQFYATARRCSASPRPRPEAARRWSPARARSRRSSGGTRQSSRTPGASPVASA